MYHDRVERKKIELSSARPRALDPKAVVTAIFKVTEPGYVPPGVQVRARVDETLFTGSFLGEHLAQLEADALVASMSISSRLRMID